MSARSKKKKKCFTSTQLYKTKKRNKRNSTQTIENLLKDNPDPFATSHTPTKKHNSSNKNKRRFRGKPQTPFSVYMTPMHNHKQPKKKRRVSAIESITSHSSSDIEILNNHKPNHHHGLYSRHKFNTNHNHKSARKRRKSPTKSSYNIYANQIIHTQNGHDSYSMDCSNASANSADLIIPFHQEKNRSILHPHDPLDVDSYKSHKSSLSIKRDKSFDETYSHYSRMSRRSKSRSRSPPKSPVSEFSAKMTEPQDQLALMAVTKSRKKSPKQTNDTQQTERNHNHKINYSSLGNLFSSNHNGAKSKPKVIKKYKRNKKHKKMFLSMRTSHLNELPIDANVARNGEILTTDLDKTSFRDLMDMSSEEKTKQISKHLNPALAAFVAETDRMEIEKKATQKEEEEKVEIDLTLEEDDDDSIAVEDEDEDDDVVILNKHKSPFSLKKAREQSRKKFDAQIMDDVYRQQRFDEEYDTKRQRNVHILRHIREYRKRKEEERKRKEEEERLRQEAARKAMEAQQALEAAEAMESDSKCREDKLRELDEDDQNLIDEVFDLSMDKVVGTHKGSNIEVRVKDLQTLIDGQWLNDEVMNFYMALLQDRNLKRVKEDENHSRVLFMNTFFFTKLSSNSYNYKAVKRWTKKAKLKKKGLCTIDTIFELDKFIFPVHVNNIHWCCGCVNLKEKKFEYFDSMNGSAVNFFRIIRKYIEDEFKDKLKSDTTKYDLNLSEWRDENHHDRYPQQQNGYDCGVFTSKCADWISDDLYPDYNQQDMHYFRERIMVEIIRGKTLDF